MFNNLNTKIEDLERFWLKLESRQEPLWLEMSELKNSETLNTLDTLKEFLLNTNQLPNFNKEDKSLNKKDLWIKPPQMFLEPDIYPLLRTVHTEEIMMIININMVKRE